MRSSAVISLAALFAAAASAGPISKFDQQQPTDDFITAPAMADVERCLLDVDGWLVPTVFRQADRPGQVMLLWMASPSGGGMPIARIDLTSASNGTHVRMWMPAFRHPERISQCAPAGK